LQVSRSLEIAAAHRRKANRRSTRTSPKGRGPDGTGGTGPD